MPLTRVDPQAALIVIDLQRGLVAMPFALPMSTVVDRCARLAWAFRDRRLPVVLVNVTGTPPGRTDAGSGAFTVSPGSTDLVPELAAAEGDFRVTKQTAGAFTGTPLDDYLRGRGVTQVFVVGVATSRGVESTARSAHDLGYNVVLVTDAMTDRDAETHARSVTMAFPRIGETDETDRVLALLRSSP